MTDLDKLLCDFDIYVPKVTDENAKEILETIADKWKNMIKDSNLSQTVAFESNCQCIEECCANCEKRWMGECSTTCYTFNFDCDKCPKSKIE